MKPTSIAGRNLGFRWDGKVRHTLLINRSLFRLLAASPALAHSRYGWELVLDKHQRSTVMATLAGKDDGATLQ